MTVTVSDIKSIRRKIEPLVGQTVWGIKIVGKPENSVTILNFGDRIIPADADPYGDWILWIYRCELRLDDKDKILVGSGDDQQKIQTHLQSLENLPIASVHISRPALDTTLNFDHQFYLRLFPVYMDKYYHWKLWFPNADSLIIGPGSSWAYEKNAEDKS
jgi:hypothetical protein